MGASEKRKEKHNLFTFLLLNVKIYQRSHKVCKKAYFQVHFCLPLTEIDTRTLIIRH